MHEGAYECTSRSTSTQVGYLVAEPREQVGAAPVRHAVHAAVHREARPPRVARGERVGDVLGGGAQERRVEAAAHADDLRLLDAEAFVVLLDELERLRVRDRLGSTSTRFESNRIGQHAHLNVAADDFHAVRQVVGHLDVGDDAVLEPAVEASSGDGEFDVRVARVREHDEHAARRRDALARTRASVNVHHAEALLEADDAGRDERRVLTNAEARGADAVLEVLRVPHAVQRERHHRAHERGRLRVFNVVLEGGRGTLEAQLQQVVADLRVRALPQLAHLTYLQRLLRHADELVACSRHEQLHQSQHPHSISMRAPRKGIGGVQYARTLSREDDYERLLGVDPAVHVDGPRLLVHQLWLPPLARHLGTRRQCAVCTRPLEEAADGHLSRGTSDPSQS